jgi:hypothetical protein
MRIRTPWLKTKKHGLFFGSKPIREAVEETFPRRFRQIAVVSPRDTIDCWLLGRFAVRAALIDDTKGRAGIRINQD